MSLPSCILSYLKIAKVEAKANKISAFEYGMRIDVFMSVGKSRNELYAKYRRDAEET